MNDRHSKIMLRTCMLDKFRSFSLILAWFLWLWQWVFINVRTIMKYFFLNIFIVATRLYIIIDRFDKNYFISFHVRWNSISFTSNLQTACSWFFFNFFFQQAVTKLTEFMVKVKTKLNLNVESLRFWIRYVQCVFLHTLRT